MIVYQFEEVPFYSLFAESLKKNVRYFFAPFIEMIFEFMIIEMTIWSSPSVLSHSELNN